jgi:hypothetical protein
MSVRIGKVRLKSGGAPITVLNTPELSKKRVIDLGWGTVTCELVELDRSTYLYNETAYYMLAAGQSKIMNGD